MKYLKRNYRKCLCLCCLTIFVSSFLINNWWTCCGKGNFKIDVLKQSFQHQNSTKEKIILFWNRPPWTPKNLTFENCQFSNCRITDDRNQMVYSRAVIFHAEGLSNPPKKLKDQIWIYHNQEPPFLSPNLTQWKYLFNWTFNYRRDSDIVSMYSSLRKRNSPFKNEPDLLKKKKKMFAWFVGNCKTPSKREKYVDQLQTFSKVDIYGKCGIMKCSNRNWGNKMLCDYMLNTVYKFYLSFENSLYRDYITEKAFRCFKSIITPIVRNGAHSHLYFPPNSYIDTKSFKNVSDLYNFVLGVAENQTRYESYHEWRQHYEIDGRVYDNFYKPSVVCGLCKKINTAKESRVYPDINLWYKM